MSEVKNEVFARDSEQILCLTPNRSSQQGYSSNKKQLLRDKLFTMLPRPPKSCMRKGVALLKYIHGKFVSVTFHLLRCNSWRCPRCAPEKAKQVMRLLREIIILNEMRFFLTLTLDPSLIPEKFKKHTHKYIMKIFNTFLTNIRRIQKDLKYVWVIEFQKNGNAHLHIVLNTRLDINLVREIWTRIGGGVQIHVDYIKDLSSVAYYISKYIGKGLEKLQFLRHFEKRYGISRSCIRPKKTSQPFYPELSNFGKQVVMHQQGNAWVYNKLLRGDFVDGEEISAPEIPI